MGKDEVKVMGVPNVRKCGSKFEDREPPKRIKIEKTAIILLYHFQTLVQHI